MYHRYDLRGWIGLGWDYGTKNTIKDGGSTAMNSIVVDGLDGRILLIKLFLLAVLF